MNNSSNWDESKHPRDNEGKFTYKNGGRYSSDVIFEKDNNRDDIPYSNNKEENTSNDNSHKDNIFKIIYPIVLDLLKQYLLSKNKEEKTQIINNINKYIIYSDKNNKNDDIKLNTNNIKSTNTRNNKTISKETKSNQIDKINNLVQ